MTADQASSGCQAQGPVCSHDAQISKVKYLFFISNILLSPFLLKFCLKFVLDYRSTIYCQGGTAACVCLGKQHIAYTHITIGTCSATDT